MDIYTPFTYIIGWSQHKKFYYGAKYAQGCQPSDLWESYFTSSKYVTEFRKENGEPDIIKIHRIFSDANSCILFEQQYLTRIDAKNNPAFLNMSNGGKNFINPTGNPQIKSIQSKLVNDGSHNFLKREDGSSIGKEISNLRVSTGKHHFLMREDGSSIGKESNNFRVKNKTHNLLKRDDGGSIAKDITTKRIEDGTHNFFQNKNTVPCYNKSGDYKRIPKNQYYSQQGNKENWEWVCNTSTEGKRRKNLILTGGS
nr:MAG: hypothetical protein [Caudoviricetes sp.]